MFNKFAALLLNSNAQNRISPNALESFSVKGSQLLKSLKSGDAFKNLPDNSNQIAIFTSKDQEKANAFTKGQESQFCAFLTVYLRKIFNSCSFQVVNSENRPWIKAGGDKGTENKPDFYLTHEAFVQKSSLPPASSNAPNNTDWLCGRLHWECSDCPDIIEVKVTKGETNVGIGEIISNVSHLSKHSVKEYDRTNRYCALVNQEEFFLITCLTDGTPFQIINSPWTRPGSLAAFRNFFNSRPALEIVLADTLSKLNLTLHFLESGKKDNPFYSALLGSGAIGRVFMVKDAAGSTLALKIAVNEENVYYLQKELDYLQVLPNDLFAKSNMKQIHKVENEGVTIGAGFTISPVGIAVSKLKTNKPKAIEVFTALNNLHQAGYVHGDPRVQNIIQIPSSSSSSSSSSPSSSSSSSPSLRKLVWIDAMATKRMLSPGDFSEDIKKLVQSWLNETHVKEQANDIYGKSLSLDNLKKVLQINGIDPNSTYEYSSSNTSDI